MPRLKTLEVYNKLGHFMRINESDFNPEEHFLDPLEDKPKASKSKAKADEPEPEDKADEPKAKAPAKKGK